jgi:hypothetical protein
MNVHNTTFLEDGDEVDSEHLQQLIDTNRLLLPKNLRRKLRALPEEPVIPLENVYSTISGSSRAVRNTHNNERSANVGTRTPPTPTSSSPAYSHYQRYQYHAKEKDPSWKQQLPRNKARNQSTSADEDVYPYKYKDFSRQRPPPKSTEDARKKLRNDLLRMFMLEKGIDRDTVLKCLNRLETMGFILSNEPSFIYLFERECHAMSQHTHFVEKKRSKKYVEPPAQPAPLAPQEDVEAMLLFERFGIDLSLQSSLAPPEPQTEEDTDICKTCFSNYCNIMYLPCEHQYTCLACFPKLKECPLCRKPIERIAPVDV